nr:MAG TPA: hypothetical protein [Herelleviridae sp.]
MRSPEEGCVNRIYRGTRQKSSELIRVKNYSG